MIRIQKNEGLSYVVDGNVNEILIYSLIPSFRIDIIGEELYEKYKS